MHPETTKSNEYYIIRQASFSSGQYPRSWLSPDTNGQENNNAKSVDVPEGSAPQWPSCQ